MTEAEVDPEKYIRMLAYDAAPSRVAKLSVLFFMVSHCFQELYGGDPPAISEIVDVITHLPRLELKRHILHDLPRVVEHIRRGIYDQMDAPEASILFEELRPKYQTYEILERQTHQVVTEDEIREHFGRRLDTPQKLGPSAARGRSSSARR